MDVGTVTWPVDIHLHSVSSPSVEIFDSNTDFEEEKQAHLDASTETSQVLRHSNIVSEVNPPVDVEAASLNLKNSHLKFPRFTFQYRSFGS